MVTMVKIFVMYILPQLKKKKEWNLKGQAWKEWEMWSRQRKQ